MIVDTHCHLYREYYEDLDNILEDMKKENIFAIVNGCDLKTNKEAIELSKNNSNIFASIGYHPTEISNKEDLKYLEDNINSVVAVGEIGLDYYWDKNNSNIQIDILEKQLQLAEKHKIPVIIHNREATKDIYDILKKYKLKGVIHAFSGSYESANLFIKLGYKLGIGGVITFKNSNLKDVIKKISIKDILLETDSPYLTPEPNRGKRNDPTNLKYIVTKIAEIKEMDEEEVKTVTTNNAIELFDLNIKIC